MSKLTKRESALAWNSQAPLHMDRVVPPKRATDPNAPKEWRDLQMPCVRETRARMKLDKNLRFIAAGAAQNKLNTQQAGFAKSMGWERGIADIILFYNAPFKMHVVELKLPGKPLSEEQQSFFAYWFRAGIRCDRVDSVKEFCKILDGFCG